MVCVVRLDEGDDHDSVMAAVPNAIKHMRQTYVHDDITSTCERELGSQQ